MGGKELSHSIPPWNGCLEEVLEETRGGGRDPTGEDVTLRKCFSLPADGKGAQGATSGLG